MTDKATPTITLAELYENQNQYIDALVIYKTLYKEDPTEELQNKIDELKDKIFKENTLEYSTIIDKIFTEEEKRIFHILPHEQYKSYKESQADLKNEETYPEELTAVKEEEIAEKEIAPEEIAPEQIAPEEIAPEEIEPEEIEPEETTPEETDELEIEEETPEIENILEPEIEIEKEETFERENTIDKDILTEEELTPQVEEIPEIVEEKTPDIENTIENDVIVDEVDELKEEKIEDIIPEVEEIPIIDDAIELEETQEKDDSLEDDISLEIEEDLKEKLEKEEAVIEPDTKIEDEVSIEDNMEKETIEKDIEELNEIIDTEETDRSEDIKDKIEPIVKPQDKNKILELLTELSNLRPDIVDRVLKENVGSDTPLAEIKLTDLNFVVELLKASENVKKD